MKMQVEHHYDAELEAVFTLISDAGFQERKYTTLGATNVSVEKNETDEGGCAVITTRTVVVDLPGFAKKFLQPTQTATQNEVWSAAQADGSRVCTYGVESKGVPGRISGRHTLRPASGGGTDHSIEIEIKMSIPLVGGKIENFAGDTARVDLAAQFAYTDKELAAG